MAGFFVARRSMRGSKRNDLEVGGLRVVRAQVFGDGVDHSEKHQCEDIFADEPWKHLPKQSQRRAIHDTWFWCASGAMKI
jgi:hypothetical protein